MATFTYDISGYLDLTRIDDTEYLKEKSLHWNTKDNYTILKYKKTSINSETVSTLGNFRSVVIDNQTHDVVAFSPPKSYTVEDFTKNVGGELAFEEYIDGTMVNLFFHNGEWQMATRSILGGKGVFFDGRKTFREMFLECMIEDGLEFDDLNKEYSYSFVVQHCENRIVTNYTSNHLVLCAIYSCQGTTVTSIPLSEFKCDWNGSFPKKYTDISSIDAVYVKMDITPYYVPGVVITDGIIRTKIRNPNYEYVRKLRGNQPKSQYHYLSLRHTGMLTEFLEYYPEYSDEFSEFSAQVFEFMNNLYAFYHRCYAKKEKPLGEFPKEYRQHMYQLHQMYISEYREKSEYITKQIVMKYVDDMEPAHLMYAINYKHRSTVL